MAPRPRPRTSQTLDSRCSRGLKSYRCRVCQGIHPLRKCNRFLRLSSEKRLRAVLVNKYCHNCLAHQHSGGKCRSGDACKKCGQDHHTLLHMHEMPAIARQSPFQQRHQSPSPQRRHSPSPIRQQSPQQQSSASQSRSAGPPDQTRPSSQQAASMVAPAVTSLQQHRCLHILPTAIVVIDTGANCYETGALIDPCTPVSSIDSSLARAFRLPTTNDGDDRVCSTTIRSRSGDFNVDVVLKIDNSLRIRTPIRALSDEVRAKFSDIRLADDQFHRPATISLVLGSDVYPRVMQPGFLNLQDGLPIAQNTAFGWIVSGACRQS